MKSPAEHRTIQLELTSSCVKKCSNCTRFSGTKLKESFLAEEQFRAGIDSLVEYSLQPHAMIGFMGGESLLHPKFREFCEYASSKISRDKLGLWSTFPDAPKYKAYADVIVKTFGNILLNDHSRDDIMHAPVLMAAEEYFRKPCPECNGTKHVAKWKDDPSGVQRECLSCDDKGTVTDDASMFRAQEHCWIQESWSSSINPKGAWFCEVAAALSDLFDGPEGWKVEPGWWKRTPMDFKEQRDWACRRCGAALPIERIRNSQDPGDDVSPGNLKRLMEIKSKKVARGEYNLHEEFKFDPKLLENHGYPTQPYKEFQYRQGIADRYGILLKMNSRGYFEPTLKPANYIPPPPPPTPLFNIMVEKHK